MKCVEGEPMRLAERYRGFTLTEVLMAVGILGVGLTMVASIFPVAVDQSRRSQDQTSAALCARSAAAGMRIQRDGACTYMRDKKYGFIDNAIPSAMLLYNPNVFLYSKSRTYDGVSTWDGGNLVARVWLFPVSRTAGDGNGRGPWRATILVFKARGDTPVLSGYWAEWRIKKKDMGPGSYVYEYRWQGYGYMVDYVDFADGADGTGYFSVGIP
ncbi:MAG TPA: type II secretion system protein, partial [Phycisphaerae bacterium]|nr:type II secretion system protein [Phycisphaerae bacterium]